MTGSRGSQVPPILVTRQDCLVSCTQPSDSGCILPEQMAGMRQFTVSHMLDCTPEGQEQQQGQPSGLLLSTRKG